MWAVALAAVLPVVCLSARAQDSGAGSFVSVEDGHFSLDGRPYYFAGTNLWFGMYLGAAGETGDRDRLLAELDQLAGQGVTNLRIMAASEGPNSEPWRITPAVQPSPRRYDESLLEGLDFLLAEMAKREMKAVLVLNNFFQWSGGMAQYVSWSTGTAIPYPSPEQGGPSWDDFQNYAARFYALDRARLLFLDFVYELVHRTNRFTGLRYRDDPTIMAWQLANEPRGFGYSEEYVAWVDEAAGFIQLIDPNHLVSLGGEGKLIPANATQFERVSRSPYLDYITAHIWIENWGWFDPANAEETFPTAVGRAMGYLADHVSIARALRKPLVLEEFGVSRDDGSFEPDTPTTYRDRFLRMMLEALLSLSIEGNAVGGSNVWSWSGSAVPLRPGETWRPGEPLVGDPPHEMQGWYSIYTKDDTTVDILSEYAGRMSAIGATDKSSSGLSAAVRSSLRRDVLDAWYPRVLDYEFGGYLSNLDFDWTPLPGQEKMIVTQARHVWTTSKAATFFPERREEYLAMASHGVEFLRDRMWDVKRGGFRSLVSREGRLILGSDPFTQGKTAYGNAFAIYALAAHYAASGEDASLDLAQRTFRWLDSRLHDPDYGGYFQFVGDDDAALRQGWGHHPPKDQNSSIHLLEAFTELYALWPDPLLRHRLNEMLVLVRDTIVSKRGYLRLFFEADWTPISFRDSSATVRQANYELDHVSYGHDVETAFLMIEAAQVLGVDPTETIAAGRRMVDHALAFGWDNGAGGLFDGGYYVSEVDPPLVVADGKAWWGQAEALNAFHMMSRITSDGGQLYSDRFHDMWEYIQEYLVDHEHGGWYAGGLDVRPEIATAPKASIWKGSYHTARALMNVVHRLEHREN